MKKIIIAAAILLCSVSAFAQTNLQIMYDFGKDRQYVTTTFEMFKGDKFGDTFFFIDHYFATGTQRNFGNASAINGSYFEIERGINFWQNSSLKDFSLHVEYDGSTWGAGILCFGAKYCFHSPDFRNMFTAYLMYDQHIGVGYADVPVKFSGVWGFNDLFGAPGLVFKGFFDIWGNNMVQNNTTVAKCSFLSEPQLWYNVGRHFNCENLHIGGEVELSYNFAGVTGFMCRPCLGIKWDF